MKMILPDLEVCGGCRTCESICSLAHNGNGVINPRSARLSVVKDEEAGVYIPFPCLQCREPYCQKVCPVNAIYVHEETGAKIINSNVCIGCRMCAIACPFGGPVADDSTGKMTKCDFCQDRGEPQCVKWCPMEALKFIEVEDLGSLKKAAATHKLANVINTIAESESKGGH